MDNSDRPQTNAPKRPRHRSPSYPAIDLERAIERTQRLWDLAGKHPAPLESAVKAWGYSPKSSGGLQTIAALKQYGFLNDSGTGWGRQITLTKAAQELLVYEADRDSPDWATRAAEAALRPKVHRTLWQKYGGSLPDDSVMLPFLKLDLGFSDDSAADMLKRFRSSIAFANLAEAAGSVSQDDEDSSDQNVGNGGVEQVVTSSTLEKRSPNLQSPPTTPGQRSVQIPYSPTTWAVIQAPFPLSEADWEAMIATLNDMKRGLVQPDEVDARAYPSEPEQPS